MFYVILDTLLKVSLSTNKTGHHVLRYACHIVESVVKHQKNWSPCSTLIPDTFFKVALNTNKTDYHVLRYTWHIVESVIKHQ